MASIQMTEDRALLLGTVRELVREKSPVSAFRNLRDTGAEAGFDRALYQEMCALGLFGLIVPEASGGAGLGYVELGLLFEELGKTLAASPMFATIALSGSVLLRAGGGQSEALLASAASGETLIALAYNERHHHDPIDCDTRATRTGAGFSLTGNKTFVLDAHVSDVLLVLARTAGSRRDEQGLSLFAVPRTTEGVAIERLGMVDARNAGHVTLKDAYVGEEALIGTLDGAFALLEGALDRAAIVLSAEMLGSAQAAFSMTLEYLKTRKQFGVPIGSFQGLKHRAADLYAELELSRSVVMDALCAIDAGRFDVSKAASTAKARLSDVFVRVASEAIQMHGGIGVTDEHDIGFFYKRARVTQLLLGDGSYHRARFATLSGY